MRRRLTWGCRSVVLRFPAASALGATRVSERFVGRGNLSDGQRPILILAASCDRVNRCRNLVCLLSCPGGNDR